MHFTFNANLCFTKSKGKIPVWNFIFGGCDITLNMVSYCWSSPQDSPRLYDKTVPISQQFPREVHALPVRILSRETGHTSETGPPAAVLGQRPRVNHGFLTA